MDLLNALPPLPVIFGQLLIGLINGGFYAVLSMGLAIIFGMLHVVNFAHGAQYMLGALCAVLLLDWLGVDYWAALVIAPLIVGAAGLALERILIRRLYPLHHMYGMLLTFGVSLVTEGLVREQFGASGTRYPIPAALNWGMNLGFMYLPAYRAWVILMSLLLCFGTWFFIEKTKFGSYIRASAENAEITRTFGINVPRLMMLTYGFGVALAAFAGVLAAPIYQVNAQMGSDIIIVVFAVVVIGGMGSLKGAILSGLMLGIAEGMTKVFYPEASTTIVFVIMVIVLLLRPAGLFGSPDHAISSRGISDAATASASGARLSAVLLLALLALGAVAPLFLYPVFAMKILCFALFASAFNLVLGFSGLLSFGHAAFYGAGSYALAYLLKAQGVDPVTGLIVSTLVAGLLGGLFGQLAIRRQGIYFAMITLALAQMVYFFAVQAPFTNNDEGIQAVPRGLAFGLIDLSRELNMYYFAFAIVAAAICLIHRVVHSPYGNILKSIRENEARAISLGYDADRFKLIAFVISAALSGLAGGLDALVFQLASLTNVHWTMSGHVLLMAILGGVGTLPGPIVGAIIVAAMENYLAALGGWVSVVHGLIFIACVMVFRRGVVGTLLAWTGRHRLSGISINPLRTMLRRTRRDNV